MAARTRRGRLGRATGRGRPAFSVALVLGLGAASPGLAVAQDDPERAITGVVFRDDDGDGRRDAGEPPVADVAVWFETTDHTRTDAAGRFTLRAPSGPGVVWVRVPDGFRAPAWAAIGGEGDATVELALRPAPRAAGPVRFVAASDSHVGLPGLDGAALGEVLAAAVRAHRPDFVALTGDVSQNAWAPELDAIAGVALGLGAPLIALAGNHDWYDGGAAYRAALGPPSHAFDVGGWHVVALAYALTAEEKLAFVAADRALGDGRPAIALLHGPADPGLARALADAGVRAVFSGHQHANRVLHHPGGLVEYATQPLLMGGMDQTPAGYRVVELGPSDLAGVAHHWAPPRDAAGAAATRSTPAVWRTALPQPVVGGGLTLADGVLYVPQADLDDGEGGGLVALDAATGAPRWSYSAGGSVRAAATVAEGAIALVTVDGRLIALDAATGRERWEVQLGADLEPRRRSTTSAPLIEGGVVYAGVLRDFGAFDLATGAVRWRIAPSPTGGDATTFAAPVLAGDLVLVSFDRGWNGLYAYDAATGAEVWRAPGVATGAEGAAAVAGDRAYVVDWETQVSALALADGRVLWTRRASSSGTPWSYGALAGPVLASGEVLAATMHGGLVALDAASGTDRWAFAPGPARLRLAHYPSTDRGANLAPLVLGDERWLVGVDGVVRGLDVGGAEFAALDLGEAVLARLVCDGERLYLATASGVVQALSLAALHGRSGNPDEPDDEVAASAPSRPRALLVVVATTAGLGLIGLTIAAVARARARARR